MSLFVSPASETVSHGAACVMVWCHEILEHGLVFRKICCNANVAKLQKPNFSVCVGSSKPRP